MRIEIGKWKREKGRGAFLRAKSSNGCFGFSIFHFRFSIFLGRAWWWLRQVSGDDAYENYLRRAVAGKARGGKDARPMSPEEFYLDALRRRYAGVSRCC